ncbi:MAG: pyruvate formate lyase family protein [Planctomycetota bacterium]
MGAHVVLQSPRIEEAFDVLRFKDVRSASIERLRLTIEADARVQSMPQSLQLGHGLGYILGRISLPVTPHDLLLGRISEEVPDAEGERLIRDTAARWKGRTIPPWMPDGGHECFAWDRLLRLGLSGLQIFAEEEMQRRTEAKPATLDWLRGAVLVYEALRRYARRYAEAARSAGLDEAAESCAAIAERPPATFAEALQLMWLVGLVYCTTLAHNSTLTFGRMDELLLEFYRGDLRAGRLTRERAADLIEDFYCKNNLILGRGEHQMSGGSERDTGWLRNLSYDSPQYLVLGGKRADGPATANELTELFLQRVVPRFENPVMVLRYTSDLPDDTWRLACSKMRANASMMVYNDHKIIPAMVHAGIAPAEAVTYTMHGCNWPDIPGVQRSACSPWLWTPQQFLTAFLGADGEERPAFRSVDEVYDRFASVVRRDVQKVCDDLRAERRQWDEKAPGTLRVDDCFLDGPIARARSWRLGGVKYVTPVFPICSLATTADCFAAVDNLVVQSGKASLRRLQDALADDFADEESLRQLCLNAPKFGQDDDRADRHAVRVLQTVLDAIDEASRQGTDDEVIAFRCLETDMGHRFHGASVGATPDGRRKGQPTSENTSPTAGVCKRGLTAMLRSIAKLPLDKINSGALNIRISPSMVRGDEGLDKLCSLLRTYFGIGGLQAQLSFVDTDDLRAAQTNPEAYRDLMVRITGYSAVFVDMSDTAQKEIIRREEMGE